MIIHIVGLRKQEGEELWVPDEANVVAKVTLQDQKVDLDVYDPRHQARLQQFFSTRQVIHRFGAPAGGVSADAWDEVEPWDPRIEAALPRFLSVMGLDYIVVEEDAVAPDAARKAASGSLHPIVAPLVGTFYRAPQPGAAPFVEVGGTVDKGQTVAIVEAMNILNRVEADRPGRVVEIVVHDGEWVEFQQVLMYLEPGDWEGDMQCPQCGSTAVRPIVYGAPTPAIMTLAGEGTIVPGGAMGRLLSGQAPNWECGGCRHRWQGGLFAGGAGDSIERAVIIRGVGSTAVGIRAEKQYLTERFGLDAEAADPEPGWRLERQALLHHDGRPHDALTITLPDGTQHTVFFDVSSFFSKHGATPMGTDQASSEDMRIERKAGPVSGHYAYDDGMVATEPQEHPPIEDLLSRAGHLGDELAWKLSDSREVVTRLGNSGRAIFGGEVWILYREGPLYDLPQLSQNAPIYAVIPFLDPRTGTYDGTPGVCHWESDRVWTVDETWENYCRSTAEEAVGFLTWVEDLQEKMVPEVRDKLWIHLDFLTRQEANPPQ